MKIVDPLRPGPVTSNGLHARLERGLQPRPPARDRPERHAAAAREDRAQAKLELGPQVEAAQGRVEAALLGALQIRSLGRQRWARGIARRGVDHGTVGDELHVGDRLAVAHGAPAYVERPPFGG